MPKSTKSTGSIKFGAPWMLFGVGFTAGLCAALFPRLAPMMARGADVNIQLLHLDYIIVALLFSAMIGVVMMWFYWGTSHKPQTLFMAALGIPSLLSSSFNMTESTEVIRQQQQQQQRLEKTVQELSGIEILNEGAPAKVEGGGMSGLWDYLGVARAYAADGEQHTPVHFNPGIQTQGENARYMVVLADAPDQVQLAELERRYQQRNIPGLKVIKTDQGYYLVAGESHRTKAGAYTEALSLKQKTGIKKVRLLRVQ